MTPKNAYLNKESIKHFGQAQESKATIYIVMRVQKQIKTNLFPITVEDGEHLGFLSVYATKKAAQKVWGKNVELQECQIKQGG